MKQSLNLLLMAFLMITLPSCGWRKKATCKNRCATRGATVNMPLSSDRSVVTGNESVNGFFETDGEDFALLDQEGIQNASQVVASTDSHGIKDDFAWISAGQTSDFKSVYFDFDDSAVRADQQPLVVVDAKTAEKTLAVEPAKTIVVEGHACHSAGSRTYNIALSEKRAKAVAKELVAQGVNAENIKTVGRGSEMPALVNGKQVGGSRQQQWANRRVELHAVNA